MERAVLLLLFAALASLGAALGDGCWLDCNQADADGAAAICASEGGALCSPYEMLADEATRSTSECDMFDYAWTDDDSFTWSSESLSWSCGAGERLACVSNSHPASTDCACYDEGAQLDVRCCNCDGSSDDGAEYCEDHGYDGADFTPDVVAYPDSGYDEAGHAAGTCAYAAYEWDGQWATCCCGYPSYCCPQGEDDGCLSADEDDDGAWCDDDYAHFGGYVIDDDVEGDWTCEDDDMAVLDYSDCVEAAEEWADACDEGTPSVSYESWDGPRGCHVQNGCARARCKFVRARRMRA